MKTKFVAAALIALSAVASVPAFASGYGPAPFYRPSVGAPSSQRGQSAQTVANEERDSGTVNSDAYGGVRSVSSQAGSQSDATARAGTAAQ